MYRNNDIEIPTCGDKLSMYVRIAIYIIVLCTIFGFGLYHTTLKYII